MPQPPPLPKSSDPGTGVPPNSTLHYQAPFAQTTLRPETPKVFDTIAGPNLRLRDNLIQLGCVIVGTVAGAVIGFTINKSSGLLIGLLAGMVGSLVLSGLVIGIIRLRGARRR